LIFMLATSIGKNLARCRAIGCRLAALPEGPHHRVTGRTDRIDRNEI
jgi:hypothetical protein